jgi:chromatin remodeling complex protein RSC6
MAKNNALQKPVNLSPELEAVVGKGPLTRAQVTSKVWDHIKANKLQDSTDRRMINPDAKLGAVTGKDQISMFKMTGAVSNHFCCALPARLARRVYIFPAGRRRVVAAPPGVVSDMRKVHESGN